MKTALSPRNSTNTCQTGGWVGSRSDLAALAKHRIQPWSLLHWLNYPMIHH